MHENNNGYMLDFKRSDGAVVGSEVRVPKRRLHPVLGMLVTYVACRVDFAISHGII
jgi:hypothetical protein